MAVNVECSKASDTKPSRIHHGNTQRRPEEGRQCYRMVRLSVPRPIAFECRKNIFGQAENRCGRGALFDPSAPAGRSSHQIRSASRARPLVDDALMAAPAIIQRFQPGLTLRNRYALNASAERRRWRSTDAMNSGCTFQRLSAVRERWPSSRSACRYAGLQRA